MAHRYVCGEILAGGLQTKLPCHQVGARSSSIRGARDQDHRPVWIHHRVDAVALLLVVWRLRNNAEVRPATFPSSGSALSSA